jgi:hypothetical protein
MDTQRNDPTTADLFSDGPKRNPKENDMELQFNTHRMYTARGQEIKARLVDGIVYFYDQSRMIGGQFKLGEHSSFNERTVMRNYDANKYEMWMPPCDFF